MHALLIAILEDCPVIFLFDDVSANVPFGSQGHLNFKGSESGKTGATHRIFCISMSKKM